MPVNLTVPDSADSQAIKSGNYGLKEQPRSSVSIDSIPPPAGATSTSTYTPSPDKARSIAEARGEIVAKPRDDQTHGKVVKLHGVDYMSAVDTAKVVGVVDSEILKYAKEIWSEDKDNRERYHKAKRMVSKADDDDLDNPSPRLARAIKVVEKGVLSKKKAKVEARNRIVRAKGRGRL